MQCSHRCDIICCSCLARFLLGIWLPLLPVVPQYEQARVMTAAGSIWMAFDQNTASSGNHCHPGSGAGNDNEWSLNHVAALIPIADAIHPLSQDCCSPNSQDYHPEAAAMAHIQHAVSRDAIGGLSTGHLHQTSEGRSLEGQAQFGRRRLAQVG